MAHPRKLIRNAIVAVLKAAATAADQRVFKSRSIPWRTVELPAISVLCVTEEVDEASAQTTPRELVRSADIVLDLVAWVPADGDVDDVLDDLAEQVEAAMDANRYLDDTASDSRLVSSEFGEVPEGNRPIGALRLTYRVQYLAHAPASTSHDALKTAVVTYNLGGAQHPGNRAQDQVTGLDQ